ncbi:4-hydroxythreonine-4-phosphate dehydrogenase PdxA, partial [bacterium]|nr:4-hydroxythreonine-4-phosphate dehydrogenase PdxA [bacterium]
MGHKPTIAITMGDPAGIGPEIVLKALNEKELYELCRPVIIGDLKVLKRTSENLFSSIDLRKVNIVDEALCSHGIIDVIDLDNIDMTKFIPGVVDAVNGKASYEYLMKVSHLALDGKVDALVTAPLSKEAIWKAGYRYEGQTQILGELCKTEHINMLLINQKLKVVL